MNLTDEPNQKKIEERYSLALRQTQSLLEDEHHVIANLANASALIYETMSDINWAGFYLKNDGELLLGPFQGKVACVHIALGKGVCGTAAATNRTIIVEDVHQFQGHIACDCSSRSEIVIPLRQDGAVVGVLDIDSPSVGRFNQADACWLERIAQTIEESCDWNLTFSF